MSDLRVQTPVCGSNTQVWSRRTRPSPKAPPMEYSLLLAPITVSCSGPSAIGNATEVPQPSKHAPTMNDATAENGLVPHALTALTRQKYWVAMLRSTGTVKLVVVVVVSTMMLLNAASAATWR